MEEMTASERAQMRWRLQTIRKRNLKQKRMMKTARARMEKKAKSGKRSDTVRYRVIKCKRKKMMRPNYNVFLNDGCEYCDCNQFRIFIRRAKMQKETAREIQLEQREMFWCRHILACKFALIFDKKDIHKISEEEWSRRSVEHISNNIPPAYSTKRRRGLMI